MYRALASDNQRGLIAGGEFPGFRVDIDQMKSRTFVGFETPVTLERGVHAVAERSVSEARRVHHIAALDRVCLCRKRDRFTVAAGDIEREVMRIARRECQRRTIDGEN